jgi:hypothetical protein
VIDGAGACAAGGGYTVPDASPELLASDACAPFTAPADDIGLRCVSSPSLP